MWPSVIHPKHLPVGRQGTNKLEPSVLSYQVNVNGNCQFTIIVGDTASELTCQAMQNMELSVVVYLFLNIISCLGKRIDKEHTMHLP